MYRMAVGLSDSGGMTAMLFAECGARYKTRPGLSYHVNHHHHKSEEEEEEGDDQHTSSNANNFLASTTTTTTPRSSPKPAPVSSSSSATAGGSQSELGIYSLLLLLPNLPMLYFGLVCSLLRCALGDFFFVT